MITQIALFFLILKENEFSVIDYNYISIIYVLFIHIISFLIISKIKSDFIDLYNLEKNLVTANRIKYLPSIFWIVIKSQRRIHISKFNEEIELGDQNAIVNITMVISLWCDSCRMALDNVRHLLNVMPNNIRVTIRFKEAPSDIGVPLIIGLWLKIKDRTDYLFDILNDWYRLANPKKFNELYDGGLLEMGDEIESIRSAYSSWFKRNSINRTPSIFINGFEMPKDYSSKELVMILPSFIDFLSQKLSFDKNISEEVN